ncbi:MAG: MOSC domain-containing protein [Rubrimonas sp.]|uniref:MOSC domain-containing protein n=1 Tax=Rubrimonas sp. TaxID=2036015 RepID=UPI002FDE6EF8
MAILTPTDLFGRVVWLGIVRDRAVTLESEPVETMALDWAGPVGECHGGLTRPSCSRVKLQYPRGTEIRNARQLSMLSAEDLADIAAGLGVPEVPPAWTGANIVFEGLPEFTMVPPGARLLFEGGASVAVDMENGPCRFVAERIEARHPGRGMAFPEVARGRRGVTGWVEKTGEVRLGETARLHVPPQRVYAPALERARAARGAG